MMPKFLDDAGLTHYTELVKGAINALTNTLSGKAPISHASATPNYGAGTADKYGHVKTVDDFVNVASYSDGCITPAAISSILPSPSRKRTTYLFGDSYAQPGPVSEGSNTAGYYLSQYDNLHLTNKSIGGTGFISSNGSNTFPTMVSNAGKHPEVDLVIIAGGRNDTAFVSGDNVKNAAEATFSSARDNFPNAEIVMVSCMYDWKRPPSALFNVHGQIKAAALKYGVRVLDGCWTWGLGKKDTFFNQKGIHPNNTGAKYYADAIYTAVMSGQEDCGINLYGTILATSGNGVSVTANKYNITFSGIFETADTSGNVQHTSAFPTFISPENASGGGEQFFGPVFSLGDGKSYYLNLKYENGNIVFKIGGKDSYNPNQRYRCLLTIPIQGD